MMGLAIRVGVQIFAFNSYFMSWDARVVLPSTTTTQTNSFN
jgi:hypothetical protein